MTLVKAQIILKSYINSNGLFSSSPYINWTFGEDIWLDGEFSVDEIEAIAVYMRSKE